MRVNGIAKYRKPIDLFGKLFLRYLSTQISQLPGHRRPHPSAKLRSRIAYETSSCRRNPSIDADRLPCDPRGTVRAEKRDGRRHLVGSGDAKRCELCRLAHQPRAEIVFPKALVERRAAAARESGIAAC